MSVRRLPLLLLALLLGLAACATPGGSSTPGILLPPLTSTRPPTATAQPGLVTATTAATDLPEPTITPDLSLASATPLIEPATGSPSPTPEGPCTNNASFVADITVPDGAQFQPGEPIDKQWRVKNTGTCEWGPDYRLVLVSGNALSARGEAALYPAKPGVEAILELPMVAPQEPGKYTGRWQARDPSGKLFGDRIFITIEVLGPPPTETATPTP